MWIAGDHRVKAFAMEDDAVSCEYTLQTGYRVNALTTVGDRLFAAVGKEVKYWDVGSVEKHVKDIPGMRLKVRKQILFFQCWTGYSGVGRFDLWHRSYLSPVFVLLSELRRNQRVRLLVHEMESPCLHQKRSQPVSSAFLLSVIVPSKIYSSDLQAMSASFTLSLFILEFNMSMFRVSLGFCFHGNSLFRSDIPTTSSVKMYERLATFENRRSLGLTSNPFTSRTFVGRSGS